MNEWREWGVKKENIYSACLLGREWNTVPVSITYHYVVECCVSSVSRYASVSNG